MDQSYKVQHEQFVSDHSGTNVVEIACMVTTGPLVVLLRHVAQPWARMFPAKPSVRTKFVCDFILLVLPIIAVTTVLSSHTDAVLTALLCVIFGILVCNEIMNNFSQWKPTRPRNLASLLDVKTPERMSFITNYRALINITSCVCILAVDFVVFPRRYCKAETYGTGLMDVGVGAYVMCNAIVSPATKETYLGHRTFLDKCNAIFKALLTTLPLLVLGVIRFLSLKVVDYHEHVSEYGVHWNFFLTLAVVRMLSIVILCFFNPARSWLISMCLALGYQYLLSVHGLREFVLTGSDGQGSRVGLLDANREGIFSSIGYLAIYFVGIQVGCFLQKPRSTLRDWLRAVAVLMAVQTLFWFLLKFSENGTESVSRRMANLSYILWMVAFNLHVMCAVLVIELVTITLTELNMTVYRFIDYKPQTQSTFCLLQAVNRNGLFYFLAANLLTGFINLTLATLHASPVSGFIILCGYQFVVCGLTAYLYHKKIYLKCG